MPAGRFERAQLLIVGCAAMFGCLRSDRTCASTAGLCASSYAAATARFKSVHSLYRASTELQTDHAYNTKHRSK
jgi:hypothetical protein